MRIALSQINTFLGDFDSNTNKVLTETKKALKEAKAELIVFPELTLLGYAPYDLLRRPEIITQQKESLKTLTEKLPEDIGVLVGGLYEEDGYIYNAAYFIYNNEILKVFKKDLLPEYDVFYDKRHFQKGDLKENFLEFKGKSLFITICEDIWGEVQSIKHKKNPLDDIQGEIDIFLNLSASPYTHTKMGSREKIAKKLVKKHNCDFVYVNQVGAQDELIFDGQSFYYSKEKNKAHFLPPFEEVTAMASDLPEDRLSFVKEKFLFEALSLGIKDYFKKTGFKKAVLGLSGGIDSALVYCLAVHALGKDNVTAIGMPGPYSSELSLNLAKELAKNHKTEFYTHSINDSYENILNSYEKNFGANEFGIVQENMQARLRGVTLMAHSNQTGALLLATSNKSELTVGYSTLYGDQCGALLPIGDLLKTEVFEVCKWYNTEHETKIPEEIITRPPSAELKPDQKDSDTLPDYQDLDQAIDNVITYSLAPQNELEKWVLNRCFLSEYKRWQSAPVLKVSPKSYGRGRMMPLAHRFKSD